MSQIDAEHPLRRSALETVLLFFAFSDRTLSAVRLFELQSEPVPAPESPEKDLTKVYHSNDWNKVRRNRARERPQNELGGEHLPNIGLLREGYRAGSTAEFVIGQMEVCEL